MLGQGASDALEKKQANIHDYHAFGLLLDPWAKDSIYDATREDYIENFDYQTVY